MRVKSRPTWLVKKKIGTLYKFDDNGNLTKKTRFYKRYVNEKEKERVAVNTLYKHLRKNPILIIRQTSKS
jgi:hypothetical protein